jgi:amidase
VEKIIIEMNTEELCIARLQGKLSIPEIVSAYLNQIEIVNPVINAIVSLRDRADILAEADQKQRVGGDGPLFGLPIAIKDLQDTAGMATSYGSPIYKDNVPTEDSLMVTRLRRAGAIIIGKTNTPEFGLGSHSYNPVHGVTVNPYNPKLSAGGSSGGAGAALGARMLPIADGSDMMGSLRNPAGWNNVYGFRPSYGLVPSEPSGDSFLCQLSTSGPMARTVKDLETMLRVVGVPDKRQPHSTQPFIDMGNASVQGIKIGWVGDWNGYFPMEEGILQLCSKGLDKLADLGCEIIQTIPPFAPEEIWKSWITLRNFSIATSNVELFENSSTRDLLKPEMQWEIERGLALSAKDIHDASLIRSEWFRRFAMMDVDMLAMPSAQMFPFDAKLDWPKNVAGQKMDTYHRWMEVVIAASLIGLPTLCVPVGFGATGLPMGLQLMGKRGQDAQVLSLGDVYHNATHYPQKHPPNFA